LHRCMLFWHLNFQSCHSISEKHCKRRKWIRQEKIIFIYTEIHSTGGIGSSRNII
jgi:hypothetical protein